MTTATLSANEFERLQAQLLDLKSINYSLVEKCNKLEQEIKGQAQKEVQLKDDLFKANAIIAKSKKAKDVFNLEQELEITRLKLNVQEEEFRLQQSTLLAELSKVLSHNDLLQKEQESLCFNNASQPSNDEESLQKVAVLDARIKEYESLLQKYAEKEKDDSQTDSSNEATSNRMLALEAENIELQNAILSLKNQIADFNTLQDCQRQRSEESSVKCSYLQQQVTELNDKLRRKQESYQSLSEEKEHQYNEYRKSLDNIVAKKDHEISEKAKENSSLKREIEKLKEIDQLSSAEANSIHMELDRLKRLHEDVSAQNELLQMQLHESLSANDCLSGQLQQARQDVVQMQIQVEEAQTTANRRKELVEYMSKHLEEIKDELRREKETLKAKYETELNAKDDEIHVLKDQLSGLENVSAKMTSLENASENKNEQLRKLNQELSDCTIKLDLCQVQHEEMLEKQRAELESQLKSAIQEFELMLQIKTGEIEALSAQVSKLNETTNTYKQDCKDRMEQLNVLERKHGHVVKDLKKQIQAEKLRGDKLQDRLQEVLNDVVRNRSPGLEDVKFHGDVLKQTKTNGDTGSVSSWTVVGGGHHNKDSDRHSNVGDRDSESSITMIENDNQDLIGRIAQLQRQNFDLTEKVHMLEESSSAMADDLVRKASVIQQLVKEKPLLNNPASSSSRSSSISANHPYYASSSHGSLADQQPRLQQGLRKVLDLVKVDQAAGDVRDMNKRLQLLLEETLTKNMHLQRDLELVSKEVARLKAGSSD